MKIKFTERVKLCSKYLCYALVLQLFTTSISWASYANTQEAANLKEVKISIRFDGDNILQVFRKIEAATTFTFSYNEQDLKGVNLINGNYQNKSLYDILMDISDQTYIGFKQINQLIGVSKLKQKPKAIKVEITKALQVSGKVTATEDGSAMPGVNIIVKNTTIGTITDSDGNYSINAPNENDILIFSSIGYLTEEIAINGRNTINFQMSPDIKALQEVVVVGYGTIKKTEMTGAISQIDARDFERVPVANPLQALQGRAAGLTITPTSGQPGAGNNITIRGFQSINGSNSPIFVVDGTITGGIDNLNPQDIETISILKDASSVAIYGSRAANGVIQVTTKRGTKSKAPRISFSTSQSMQEQGNLRVNYLNAKQWVEILTEAHENTNSTPITWTDADLAKYEGVDVDWPNAVMRDGALRTYDLSVSGASEKSNYLVSAGYIKNVGIIKGQDYGRLNFRINSDHKINKVISFGNSLNIYSNKQNDNTEIDGRNVYTAAFRYTPLNRMYEEDGDFGIIRNTLLEGRSPNPLWMLSNTGRVTKDRGMLGNLYLTLNIIDGLKFTTRGSLEYSSWNRENFIGATDARYGTEGSRVNQITKENSQNIHWIGDFLLDYQKVFNNKHSINTLVGYSVEENTWENLWGRRGGTPNNSIRFLDAGDPLTSVNGNGYSDWAFISTFAQLSYTFDQRYTISGVVRRDGTSRLANGTKYGTFPSISAAWRISNEKFMQNINWLSELKLRASWGSVGNVQSVSTYGTSASLAQWNYHLNQQPVIGYTLADAVNTDLIWENTTKKNIGLDASFFNSSVYLTTDFFIHDTHDLLFSQPLPSSTGYAGQPFINAAHVRNIGVDLELGYRKVLGDWSLNINGNISHFTNEVIDLDGRDLRTNGIVEGEPLFTAFGYKTNGIYRNEEDLASAPKFSNKEVGDIWFLDVNGKDENGNLTGQPDGMVNADDRTLIGRVFPDITYGAFASVGYKDFTLQLQLQGVSGIDRDMRGGRASDAFTGEPNVEADYILDRFHETRNPNGKYPEVSKDDAGQNGALSDFWLRDASYMSIRNINLNYDVPAGLANKAGLQNLSIYVGARNLYTFTSLYGTGVDVNFNPGLDNNAIRNTNPEGNNNLTAIPLPRTWTIGLKATF